MSWQADVDELQRQRRMAHQMGGEESIAFHHGRGKLTVRERIALLSDTDSFQEIGALAGRPQWEGGDLKALTPANRVIGTGKLGGRKVMIDGGDFTIRGGASDAAIADKRRYAEQHALTYRMPYVRLLDATGGSVRTFEHIGRTYIPENASGERATALLQTVPVVSAILGSVAGLPAIEACMCHFNVMVKGISQVFVAGPPVVKTALGQEIAKEDLGSERVQVFESGAVANLANSEREAFTMTRQFLSYLPSNVWEMAPRAEPTDDPQRRAEDLMTLIPLNSRRAYNAYRLLERVLDVGSFFEIQPHYGRSRITGLARVNGYPIGVMINNPNYLGGSMDLAAGEKVIRLLQLCDTFHLPLVYFADEPGFMVGLAEEKKGIVRAGARVVATLSASKTPYICFIIRQLYGVAGGLHKRTSGMYRRYAWPSANWGSMHIEGGVMAAYRREIHNAPDPEAKRQEIEARLNILKSPFRTAHAFEVEEIIDPRDTRPLLCDFIDDAQPILRSQLGPSSGLSYLP